MQDSRKPAEEGECDVDEEIRTTTSPNDDWEWWDEEGYDSEENCALRSLLDDTVAKIVSEKNTYEHFEGERRQSDTFLSGYLWLS